MLFQNTPGADHPWLLPAAIVGVAGLALQGVKAGWDLYLSVKAKANSSRSVRLQETNALLTFIDELPLDDTKKLGYKLQIVRAFQTDVSITAMYGILDAAIRSCSD
jgi:hypothetical protein